MGGGDFSESDVLVRERQMSSMCRYHEREATSPDRTLREDGAYSREVSGRIVPSPWKSQASESHVTMTRGTLAGHWRLLAYTSTNLLYLDTE